MKISSKKKEKRFQILHDVYNKNFNYRATNTTTRNCSTAGRAGFKVEKEPFIARQAKTNI